MSTTEQMSTTEEGEEIAYVNGRFMPLGEAVVPIEDRGFQFADGVYEVVATYRGRPYAIDEHMRRLQRSLTEIRIDFDVSPLPSLIQRGIERARFVEALVYIQITRGVAPRHHEFPSVEPKPAPTVVMTVKQLYRPDARLHESGVKVITTPDLRWRRCDIKSIALLPNILAKQLAHEADAYEALLVDEDGRVTEGSSTSSFLVRDGIVYTTPASASILPSITRSVLTDIIRELGIQLQEADSTVEDYLAADEVFLAGTTTEAMPVVTVDETQIGDGRPGELTRRIREAFVTSVRRG
ncbi:MAG: D-amino acid aminotransferase [Gemmatimonadetes bacterium]|jgi:D-alanine transaminase|nr:D-amino acid aminotransferase [Gemmatimonadota bacterium]MBT6149910.1 D-amino acid aminotransferase [Gemmatimonadota bacterium]MBT7860234.1 D-amino acid aminotransferase [Gemmatimonadota bacterium]